MSKIYVFLLEEKREKRHELLSLSYYNKNCVHHSYGGEFFINENPQVSAVVLAIAVFLQLDQLLNFWHQWLTTDDQGPNAPLFRIEQVFKWNSIFVELLSLPELRHIFVNIATTASFHLWRLLRDVSMVTTLIFQPTYTTTSCTFIGLNCSWKDNQRLILLTPQLSICQIYHISYVVELYYKNVQIQLLRERFLPNNGL